MLERSGKIINNGGALFKNAPRESKRNRTIHVENDSCFLLIHPPRAADTYKQTRGVQSAQPQTSSSVTARQKAHLSLDPATRANYLARISKKHHAWPTRPTSRTAADA